MARSPSDVNPVGAAAYVPSQASLSELAGAAQLCRGCELYRDATHAVLGDGPPDAALMLIGEQPGDQEDLAGKPFVGPAGRLLGRALEEAGIQPESVFRTNAVKHFRFSGTKGKRRIHQTPDRVHVQACTPWLTAELAIVEPRGVVVLGQLPRRRSSALGSRSRPSGAAFCRGRRTVTMTLRLSGCWRLSTPRRYSDHPTEVPLSPASWPISWWRPRQSNDDLRLRGHHAHDPHSQHL